MHRQKTFLIGIIALIGAAAQAHEFSGARAMDYERKIVAFGPRPPGSAALRNLRAYIVGELKLRGCEVIQDAFTARTPGGPVAMVNIIARFPGKSRQLVALTGHYDTKKMAGVRFVGADDGGSSTAFLLEMAETLQGMPHNDDIDLVWFDGEEAFGQWSDTDSVYGRALVRRWHAEPDQGADQRGHDRRQGSARDERGKLFPHAAQTDLGHSGAQRLRQVLR
jgi:hypothetical protein